MQQVPWPLLALLLLAVAVAGEPECYIRNPQCSYCTNPSFFRVCKDYCQQQSCLHVLCQGGEDEQDDEGDSNSGASYALYDIDDNDNAALPWSVQVDRGSGSAGDDDRPDWLKGEFQSAFVPQQTEADERLWSELLSSQPEMIRPYESKYSKEYQKSLQLGLVAPPTTEPPPTTTTTPTTTTSQTVTQQGDASSEANSGEDASRNLDDDSASQKDESESQEGDSESEEGDSEIQKESSEAVRGGGPQRGSGSFFTNAPRPPPQRAAGTPPPQRATKAPRKRPRQRPKTRPPTTSTSSSTSTTSTTPTTTSSKPEPKPACPNEQMRPCVSASEANRRLLDCCKQVPGMAGRCHKYCNMHVSLLKLSQMNSDRHCSREDGQLAAKCFVQSTDVTPCCQKLNVPTPCLKYCNLANDPPVGGSELLSLCAPLVTSLRNIQKCYHLSLNP